VNNLDERRYRRLFAEIQEIAADARKLRSKSPQARQLAAEILRYLRGARDYERVMGTANWVDIEATLARAQVLRERLFHEASDIDRRTGLRRGAAQARAYRSNERQALRDRVISAARARKARNPALSKAEIARLCAREYDSPHQPVTAETVRAWLKGVDL
jgi:hypothetical protein